ncbi:ECF-type sigma factor [Kribbella sp. NBC_01505]|uniref:sigma factor-like helix-turn-helix DNA-binding protein n=1 Tax=Kribbella sp. NBC_01505 TaxID=2903580 RepID=UPI00386520C5
MDRIRRQQIRVADPLPEGERHAAEVRERRLEVLNALTQISEHQRAALVLVVLEGYSIEEAAAILGVAPGTVRSRAARGRGRLLPLLRHWQTTSAGSEQSGEADDGGRPLQ